MNRHSWDERYAGAELIWTAEPNRFLVAETGSLPPGRALDIACGEGRNSVWLAGRGWDVTGVDFSAVGLEKAHALAEARGVQARWELADVTEYAPAPESFDLVIVMYLHLPEAQRRIAFRRAAAAVAGGGTLLVVAHDVTNPTQGWGGPQDPTVLYSTDDVVADLDGLDIAKAERVRRVVDTDEGEKIAIDLLVHATRARRPI